MSGAIRSTCRTGWIIGVIASAAIAVWPSAAPAQPAEELSPEPAPQPGPGVYGPALPPTYGPPADDIYYPSEPPRDFYERDWRYRMRFYRGRRFASDPYRGGPWHRYPGPVYGYEHNYLTQPAFDEGYWQGRRDGRRVARWEFQYQRGVASYSQSMRAGVVSFKAGDYARAARQFVLAAELNQGDASCRLLAAHALVALGRFHEACLTVRRALQLQPKIVYLSLDIRGEYGPNDHFDKHYQRLESAARGQQDDPSLWFLLSYYQFFSGRSIEAYDSIRHSDALDPGLRTTQRLKEAIKLSTPAEPIRNSQPLEPVPLPNEPGDGRPGQAT
jgi:hypothetical protein